LVWFGLVWFGLVWFGLIWVFQKPPHRTCVAVDPNSIHTAPSLALALLWLVCEVANLSHVVRHKYTLLTFPQSMQTSTKAGAPSISAGWHTATVRSHRQWSRASVWDDELLPVQIQLSLKGVQYPECPARPSLLGAL